NIPTKFTYEKEYLSNNFKPHTFKRGRFTIEDYSALESKYEISKEYKKGRFHVIETKPIKKPLEEGDLLKIIELQNKQINMLYSILKKDEREDQEFVKTSIQIENILKGNKKK
ncbi:hypothetical protein NGRA_0120, partial [Nosema granulosis]